MTNSGHFSQSNLNIRSDSPQMIDQHWLYGDPGCWLVVAQQQRVAQLNFGTRIPEASLLWSVEINIKSEKSHWKQTSKQAQNPSLNVVFSSFSQLTCSSRWLFSQPPLWPFSPRLFQIHPQELPRGPHPPLLLHYLKNHNAMLRLDEITLFRFISFQGEIKWHIRDRVPTLPWSLASSCRQ